MQTQPLIALISQSVREEADAILRNCVHCGFCNATCPTYQLLGDERDGPRGRIYMMKEVLEGNPATAKTQLHLDRCLTCRACETTCPSGVQYGRLLDIGREVVGKQVAWPWQDSIKRKLLCLILPYPLRFAVLYKLLQIVSPLLPKQLQQKIPDQKPIKSSWPQPKHDRKVLFLAGCVQSTLTPEINLSAARVLDKLGIGVIHAQRAGCCGALSYHLGVQADGLDFMRRNIDAWLPLLDEGVEAIVMTASGCGLMVKEYAKVLKYDDFYREKAKRIVEATMDIAELLIREDFTKLKPKPMKKLAFQSPCTLQHGQKLGGVVEHLLQKLGFRLCAVTDSHLCCGSAGTYSLLQPKLAGQLLKNKLAALEAGHPDVIVTANIGCLCHLQTKASVPVQHWLETLDEALTGCG